MTRKKENNGKEKETNKQKNMSFNFSFLFESLSKEKKLLPFFFKTLSSVVVDVDHVHPSLKS